MFQKLHTELEIKPSKDIAYVDVRYIVQISPWDWGDWCNKGESFKGSIIELEKGPPKFSTKSPEEVLEMVKLLRKQ